MIKLTPFTEDDFDTLISWIDDEELLITIAGTGFSYPLTKGQLTNYLNIKDSHSFNVKDISKDKIIGHAELVISGENMYKIDKLIIGYPSDRGKGVGQKVVSELLAYSFQILHAEVVELNVFDWNIGGIRCYENCGFVINPCKQTTFKAGDKTWTALNMRIEKVGWKK